MEQQEARAIADGYLTELQKNCPVEIEINLSLTEEHQDGFVFFYNSKEFWETRSFLAALAGNGPIFVRRDTGDLVILPSSQSVERSLSELKKTK